MDSNNEEMMQDSNEDSGSEKKDSEITTEYSPDKSSHYYDYLMGEHGIPSAGTFRGNIERVCVINKFFIFYFFEHISLFLDL